MLDKAIIFAKALNGAGGCDELKSNDAIGNETRPSWIHIDANLPQSRDALKKCAPELDDPTTEALLDQDARPRALALEQGTLVILRGVNLNEGAEAIDMIAVRLWINQNRIVSLRYRKSRSLMEVAEKLDAGKGPKTLGEVFVSISATLLHYIGQNVETLYDQLDEMESGLLGKPSRGMRQKIADVRISAIALRRYINPQKDAINQLRYDAPKWLDRSNLRKLQELQDNIVRDIEDLDAIRERCQVVKDELVNALSDKLNHNLYLISIITAIFLPLGFLTGLFGINIGGMPGVDSNAAFWIFASILGGMVAIQVVLFKIFRWF